MIISILLNIMAGVEMETSTSKPVRRGKRGPYKQYLHDPSCAIPRQTLSNWRKRGFDGTLRAPDNNSDSESETKELETSPSHDDYDCPPTSSDAHSSSSETASTPPTSAPPSPPPQSISPVQNLLYPGAQISEATGALLLHSLAMKHGLTHAALMDIQQLLCLHLPTGEATPLSYRSEHRLLNALSLRSHPEVVHMVCSDCEQLIAEPACSSNSFECMHSQIIKFYEIPLDSQIQAIFKGT